MSRRVLMIVSSPAVSSLTGWPVGFWASELIHPWHEFIIRGYDVTIASPRGGAVILDPWSDPRDPSGYSKDDLLSLQYLSDPAFVARLQSTAPIADMKMDDFDAIVVTGGQGPMFTFADEKPLHRLFEDFHYRGKVAAALCHGTSLLLHLTKPDGSPFVSGMRMTGFTNTEEEYAAAAVGQKLVPFQIEDEARRLGADFVAGKAFAPHAIRDGNLVTGQQQHSGREVATLVIDALENGAPMNIAFIGIGKVGAALAEALSRAGNQILVGAKPDSASAREVTSANPHYNHLPPEAAVARASVVFLATPFGAAEEALKPLAESLAGKILVDCTNPVGAGLSHALDSRTSGSELIQRLVPGARVVKAFTVYGYENFADAQYPGYGSLLPGMPITGDDPGAKRVVARLCRQVGFEAIDAGALSCSVHLEHATLLWIKMARVNGYGNGFTWGFLRRENR